jgi:fatty-acyl-CoA synthase
MTRRDQMEQLEWRRASIPGVLRAVARERPDHEALVIDGRRLSYAALDSEVRRVAGGLAGLGIGAGDHVAISLSNSLEWVIAWFATSWLGATAIPINTRWKDDELAWALNYADVRTVVTTRRLLKVDLLGMVERVRQRVPGLAHVVATGAEVPAWAVSFERLSGKAPPPAEDSDAIGLIQFTSGSTARPKGVMLSHGAMLLTAYGFGLALGIRPSDRFLSPRPFFHVAGSVGSILLSLVAGATLVSIPTFDALAALRVMAAEQCHLVAGNEAMFLMMLNQTDVPKLPTLRGGYAAAGPEAHRLVNKRLGIPHLCSSYGISEACSAAALSWWNDTLEDRVNGRLRPLPGVRVMVRDPVTHNTCKEGEPGELLLRGGTIMSGYYKQPEETAEAIDPDGWLSTGDLAVLESEGRFRFIGRLKDIIRVGGENVSPAEVESLLLRHEAVAEAQVVGLPDGRLGEVVVAYVVPREGTSVDPAELVQWAKDRIAGFKVPKHVGIVRSFEDVMTGSGKPRKDLLRQRATQDFNARQRRGTRSR